MKTKEELLKIYSAYLPYGLKVKLHEKDSFSNKVKELSGIMEFGLCFLGKGGYFGFTERSFEDFKPILYSMDMLTQEIEHNGERFVPIDKIKEYNLGHVNWISNEREEWINRYGFNHWFKHIPLGIYNILLEWHFNIFGLEESEYIKKETLNWSENPNS